ncbi:hypothetical protein [Anderseniella sp. Alg231-50]|uniref:hypothetical protein n=1 Tax=Anderseniella sp. Alg231-50 TaxID=1922226 RepID=UPI000D55A79A
MRWLIIYLLLIAVIWLFVTNTVWRRGLLAFSTIVFGVFMLIFTLTQRDIEADIKTADRFSEVRKQESVTFGAVKSTDIAIGKTSLTNPSRTVFDSAGRERVEADLFKWQLRTLLTNRSTEFTVTSLTLQVTLYSCPVFYDVVQADIDPGKLNANCTVIGTRTVGFDPIQLKPAGNYQGEQIVTFPNQPEPRNPRYWIKVQTVTAKLGD